MDMATPRSEEAIVSELENAKSIISKYAIYFGDQDGRNLFSFIRLEKSQPESESFTFEIRSNRP